MTFFTKDTTPVSGSAEPLTPLTKDRIKAALEREGWSYSVNSDEDFSGDWGIGGFYFFIDPKLEDVMCVRGTWNGKFEAAEMGLAREACNAWNGQTPWPKAFARKDEEGMIWFHTEYNVGYGQGLTDGQLSEHLALAVNTGMDFFAYLMRQFPAVWAKYDAERPTDS